MWPVLAEINDGCITLAEWLYYMKDVLKNEYSCCFSNLLQSKLNVGLEAI